MSGSVETKVKVGTSASAVGSVLAGLSVWALRTYVFRADVPLPVLAAVMTLVPAIVTFAASWLAPHTARPDLAVARRHADDGEPNDVPARRYMPPSAKRPDSTRHPQD